MSFAVQMQVAEMHFFQNLILKLIQIGLNSQAIKFYGTIKITSVKWLIDSKEI